MVAKASSNSYFTTFTNTDVIGTEFGGVLKNLITERVLTFEAKGMPLVVEISVAFSILIAFIVIGIFLFRIRERFDTVDVHVLDQHRGERA